MLSDVHVLLSERSEYPWMLSQNSGRAQFIFDILTVIFENLNFMNFVHKNSIFLPPSEHDLKVGTQRMLSDVHVLLSERSEYPWMLSQNSGRAH
jgi:hypothetical protein